MNRCLWSWCAVNQLSCLPVKNWRKEINHKVGNLRFSIPHENNQVFHLFQIFKKVINCYLNNWLLRKLEQGRNLTFFCPLRPQRLPCHWYSRSWCPRTECIKQLNQSGLGKTSKTTGVFPIWLWAPVVRSSAFTGKGMCSSAGCSYLIRTHPLLVSPRLLEQGGSVSYEGNRRGRAKSQYRNNCLKNKTPPRVPSLLRTKASSMKILTAGRPIDSSSLRNTDKSFLIL